MLLNITEISSETLQQQVSRQIRAMILCGDLQPGEILPSIRALARQQRISVITIQRAYEELERNGLIYSRRGKGFFVVELSDEKKKALTLARIEENLRPLIQAGIAEGLQIEDLKRVTNNLIDEEFRHD